LHVTLGADPQSLLKYLHDKGHTDAAIEKTAPTIEDCFIQLLKN
jgi:hypothetical protein